MRSKTFGKKFYVGEERYEEKILTWEKISEMKMRYKIFDTNFVPLKKFRVWECDTKKSYGENVVFEKKFLRRKCDIKNLKKILYLGKIL